MKKLLLCLLVLALVGCKDAGTQVYTKVEPNSYGSLLYQDDLTAGVRCYRFRTFEGISCVKTKEY